MITKGETYIIGEIGQNHNGSVDIAKLIVELISRPVHEEVFNLDLKPMNAVKMTRRDLNEELTTTQIKPGTKFFDLFIWKNIRRTSSFS